MQLPLRRHQRLHLRDEMDEVIHLTEIGLQHLRDDLQDLQRVQLPQAIEDVSRSVQLGDLSENAEYQEAKHRLARIHGRIFQLQERLKRVAVISHRTSTCIDLGSVVTVSTRDRIRTYHIVGPQETNPSRGRISHLSPLGLALLHKTTGDKVLVQSPQGDIEYTIVEIE